SAGNSPENRRPPRPPAEIRARSSLHPRAAIPRAASRSGSRELLRALLLSVFRGRAVRAAAQSCSFLRPKGERYTGEGNSAVDRSLAERARLRTKMGDVVSYRTSLCVPLAGHGMRAHNSSMRSLVGVLVGAALLFVVYHFYLKRMP